MRCGTAIPRMQDLLDQQLPLRILSGKVFPEHHHKIIKRSQAPAKVFVQESTQQFEESWWSVFFGVRLDQSFGNRARQIAEQGWLDLSERPDEQEKVA